MTRKVGLSYKLQRRMPNLRCFYSYLSEQFVGFESFKSQNHHVCILCHSTRIYLHSLPDQHCSSCKPTFKSYHNRFFSPQVMKALCIKKVTNNYLISLWHLREFLVCSGVVFVCIWMVLFGKLQKTIKVFYPPFVVTRMMNILSEHWKIIEKVSLL